jgi:SAM-dependent methyltransferase
MEPGWRIREWLFAAIRPLFRLGLLSSHVVTGKVRPLAERGNSLVRLRGQSETVPARRLWEGYTDHPDDYIAEGREDMGAVLALLDRHGIAQPRVAMSLGCAAGRMIRHFPRHDGDELWGLDISGPHIAWCQRNLPGINFCTVSTTPYLPFPDGHFEFVFCASVFTHITDLADAWLLAIRRILRPGGHLYATLHDRQSYAHLLTGHVQGRFATRVREFEKRRRIRDANWEMVFFGSDPASQVFYDRDYITAKWSKWMRVVAYEPLFHNYQAAMLMQKSA